MTPYSEDAAPVAPDGAGRPRGRCWRLAALAMVCFAVAVSCGAARSQAATEPVTLNFVNAEIEAVAGDLPVLGNRFRRSTRSRKKTNLMVFIRPVILRDAAQAESLSLDRYGEMRGQQAGAQPESSRLLPVDGGPILPDRPAHSGYRSRMIAKLPMLPTPKTNAE